MTGLFEAIRAGRAAGGVAGSVRAMRSVGRRRSLGGRGG